jgi:hypothetical protein
MKAGGWSGITVHIYYENMIDVEAGFKRNDVISRNVIALVGLVLITVILENLTLWKIEKSNKKVCAE